MRSRIEEAGREISERIQAAGGRALAVGGWVRDHYAGLDSKDLDLEVYGIPFPKLEALIHRKYRVDAFGKEFGVLRVRIPHLDHPIDLVLPRRELRTGPGHRGFKVELDSTMSAREAAHRRDLTINAISFDLLTQELIDPYGGLDDLQARRLRAVDPIRFGEDPLRVLRAAQFAARFEMQPTPQILQASQGIPLEELARARVFDELQKLLLLGQRPSLGLDFLRQTGHWQFFSSSAPSFESLDRFATRRTGDVREDLLVGLAVLGSLVEAPERLLDRCTGEKELIQGVLDLIRERELRLEDDFLRRQSARVRLSRFAAVQDALGHEERSAQLLARARSLGIEHAPPAPLVQGRHLLEHGLSPGPAFRALLEHAFEAQLDGRISTTEEGLRLLGIQVFR